MKGIFHRFLPLLAFALCVPAAAFAEPDNVSGMIDEIREQAPETFKLISEDRLRRAINKTKESIEAGNPVDPRKYDLTADNIDPRTKQLIVNALHGASKEPSPKSKSTIDTEAPIIGHVQAGSEKPWPSVEELAKSVNGKSDDSVDSGEPDEPPAALSASVDSLPDLPRCPRDTTLRTDFDSGSNSQETQDILFLRAEIPSGAAEIFGGHTLVFRYTQKSDDPPSITAAAIGVPCLPFRMRLAGNASFQDYGLNALKNYDKDFSGSGEVHEYVKDNAERLLR